MSLLSSLLERPSRHPRTSCSDHLRHWVTCTLLIASSLLWYTRLWLTDTRLIDETLPILTSASVGVHAQSQVINKVERMASYVMTCFLTQPPTALQRWWLLWHCCAIIITWANSASLSHPPPWNIIKAWLKWKKWDSEVFFFSLSLSLSLSKGCYLVPKSDLAFEGCVWTTRPDIFVQGSQNLRFRHRNGNFHCHD